MLNSISLRAFRSLSAQCFVCVLAANFLASSLCVQAEDLPKTSVTQSSVFEDDLLEEELFEEDLFTEGALLGDDLVSQESKITDDWRKNIHITLQQTFFQGKHREISRTDAHIEYEVAPWDGAYVRIANKYTYYGHNDKQLGQDGRSFGRNKLQEAWLQLSESSCVAKLGRQGLSWGVIEGAFAVDVVSPFDFTEPLLTDYSDIRLSQDMLLADCYFSKTQVQTFYVTSARLNTYQQTNTSALQALEDSLHDEWGFRVSHRWQGLDVTLMYAHLYGNEPLSVIDSQQASGLRLDIARYDFVGLSGAWAIGRLLLEFDLGYKHNERENFTGKEKSHLETAFGFEYTTSNNHQLNAGVWIFEGVIQKPTSQQNLKRGSMQAWTLGWSKLYLKDDLVMSFLGSWLTESDVLSSTLLAQYQWDDFWNFSSALSYTDSNQALEGLSSKGSDLGLLLKVKLEF